MDVAGYLQQGGSKLRDGDNHHEASQAADQKPEVQDQVSPMAEPSPRNNFGSSALPPASCPQSSNQRPVEKNPLDYIPRDAGWKHWPELTVRISSIPDSTQPLDLFQNLEGYGGEIVFLEVAGGVQGYPRVGRVRFSPPPDEAFWVKPSIPFTSAGTNFQVIVDVESPKQPTGDKVKSPTNPRVLYERLTKLKPISLDFGVMLDDSTMLCLRSLKDDSAQADLQMTLDLSRRHIAILFKIAFASERVGYYKIIISFRQLEKLHWHVGGSGEWVMTIPLKYPPHYFWKRDNAEKTFNERDTTWSRERLWHRATDIQTVPDGQMFRELSLHDSPETPDPCFINLGRWTTLRLLFNDTNGSRGVLNALRDFNIDVDITSKLKTEHFLFPPPQTMVKPAATYGCMVKPSGMSSALLEMMQFEVRYQLEVCISRGVFSEYTLDSKFLSKLAELDHREARCLLGFVADKAKRVVSPMSIFGIEDPRSKTETYNMKAGSHNVIMRKVLVTPTALYLTSPTLEIANRVLRRFQHLQDRFIRVQFTGELYDGRISARADSERDDHIYKRVFRVLSRGIRIGGRHYEFLAFGNSQIRENGAYFFSRTREVSCDDIRKSMGKFNHIRIVAKYAARMGQCFSSTREIRAISVPRIRPIDDIENAEGYCFTDGVGKISEFLAKIIVDELGMEPYGVVPSAFQFRMGGCKGVLAVWPEAKTREVHIRKSQAKFESEYNSLEIIRCSRFACATLNRQIITILSCLGVQTEVFLDLLNIHVDKHNNAQLRSRDAISLLRQQVDENQTTLTLAEIILHGFREPTVQEPFIATVLNLWKVWSLKLVKEKARIPIEKSAFVLGCVDETGTLRGHKKSTEGSLDKRQDMLPQIFLQITDVEDPGSATVITGICIVGRNPSLHPGDIRVVEAVDVPALRHLRDVVVFPSVGDRDLPSMLSGGDLDGDDFFVIWEPSLIPTRWNHEPMDYRAPKPLAIDHDVQVTHLQRFFVSYMKNDILPTVALAHLAHADGCAEGAKNPTCITLAKLHSKAVDYVKTGEPAEMERWLVPRRWPHFMEKRVRPEMIYRSRTALGVIYDAVCDVAFNPTYSQNFDQRVLVKAPKDEELLNKARQIKAQYDVSMRRILTQREIASEFEIWSGFVLSRPRVGSAYKVQEEVGRQYGSIKQKFRELCYQAAGGMSEGKIDNFVAAMYKVTEEEMKAALQERRSARNVVWNAAQRKEANLESKPLISFPWIFHEVLCRLAIGKTGTAGGRDPTNSTTQAVKSAVDFEGHQNGNHTTLRNEGKGLHPDGVIPSTKSDGAQPSSGTPIEEKHGASGIPDANGVRLLNKVPSKDGAIAVASPARKVDTCTTGNSALPFQANESDPTAEEPSHLETKQCGLLIDKQMETAAPATENILIDLTMTEVETSPTTIGKATSLLEAAFLNIDHTVRGDPVMIPQAEKDILSEDQFFPKLRECKDVPYMQPRVDTEAFSKGELLIDLNDGDQQHSSRVEGPLIDLSNDDEPNSLRPESEPSVVESSSEPAKADEEVSLFAGDAQVKLPVENCYKSKVG
ncbi:hypothetical protein jhhlp_003821 [Lomentospora prolificans]|uniref:RNA-directed RNA polymerase n=1 Tax=Lomentospora prolificans TaxID=41688 RepID=A0A2N3N9X5_9PEZI|nr:hypothetical protein jhhlp_003821 [Lomentospora prolificans]